MKTCVLIGCLVVGSLLQAQGLTTADYSKKEICIPMRDGVKLFTTIYAPKNTSQDYPVLMIRTCYSVAPYGPDTIPEQLMHNPDLVASGYIFVKQDVRGRWMSEGEFENTKPPYSWEDESRTDEVTDSYDTYDWLVENLENFNGNIGQYGNSYLGFTALVASVTGHSNLKAVLAMAPVTNFYFEDFNRYGLYGMNYMPVMDVFGVQKTAPTDTSWYNVMNKDFVLNAKKKIMVDYYDYFLQNRALSQTDHLINPSNFFWKNIKNHPNYDAYRQKRDWIQYLSKSQCPTMVVGGWNDEQNLYGIVKSFRKMIKDAPDSQAKLVLGPWSHGHPKRRDSLYYLGDIFYGYNLAEIYQKEIEYTYFEYHLKGRGESPDFRAHVFDTGKKQWTDFNEDPFVDSDEHITFYLRADGSLSNQPGKSNQKYLSDPDHPVPFIEDDHFHVMAPKHYMTDDQRFASKRQDVLTFVTDPLEEDMTVRGVIQALLQFSTDHEDADLYVKLIDVLPMGRLPQPTDKEDVKMNGFQHLVRAGYIRGRYRNSFEKPEPFTPHEKTEVNVPVLEVCHTFKKGHSVMIQVQSSMFPLFDLNPQKYIDNIYDAGDEDFEPALHTIYGDSKIVLPIVH